MNTELGICNATYEVSGVNPMFNSSNLAAGSLAPNFEPLVLQRNTTLILIFEAPNQNKVWYEHSHEVYNRNEIGTK